MSTQLYGPSNCWEIPTRPGHIAALVALPCMVILALWHQSMLSPTTFFAVLMLTSWLYKNLRQIQDFTRDWLRREYERFDHNIHLALLDPTLNDAERNKLLLRKEKLRAQYHLVTSPDETYRLASKLAGAIDLIIRLLRKIK